MPKVVIMSNTACMHLFNNITDPELISLKEELIVEKFSDGEMSIKPRNSVRGAYVYLFAETSHNLTELLLTLDSLTRASVYKVTLILGFYGYSRQDKRGSTRGSLGARTVAKVISCFNIVERVVSIDLHADQIQMAWDIPVDNIHGDTIFLPYIKKWLTPNTIFCSPDAGGKDRVRAYEAKLGYPMIAMDKHRIKANEVSTMRLIDDVSGKDVIIIDDMIDTAGTLKKSVDLLKANGAKTVSFVATHGILSGNAINNLATSGLTNLMISNTIRMSGEKLFEMVDALGNNSFSVVSCVPVLERVIKNIMNDGSVSEINL